MAEGDHKTIFFRTDPEFLKRFREIDALIDAEGTRESAFVKAKDAEAGARAAVRQADHVHEMQDLIFHELERHWASFVLESDPTVPEFPDDWRVQFFGRMIRVSYSERAAYKE